MDCDRFRQIIEAYGADPKRWPAEERAAAERLALERADAHALLQEALALDRALALAAEDLPPPELLSRRVLKQFSSAVRPVFDRRALWALAACAVFGLALGYGGGLRAPLADGDEDFFAMTLEAPLVDLGDEG